MNEVVIKGKNADSTFIPLVLQITLLNSQNPSAGPGSQLTVKAPYLFY